jgi:hypothetical protein
MSREKNFLKAKLLLAKAEDAACTPAEREAFLQKVDDFCRKYKFTHENLREFVTVKGIVERPISTYKSWETLVVKSLVHSYGGFLRVENFRCVVIGKLKTVKRVVALHTYITKSLHDLLISYQYEIKDLHRQNKRISSLYDNHEAWNRKEWEAVCIAYVDGFCQQLHSNIVQARDNWDKARKARKQEKDSLLPVLIISNRDQVEQDTKEALETALASKELDNEYQLVKVWEDHPQQDSYINPSTNPTSFVGDFGKGVDIHRKMGAHYAQHFDLNYVKSKRIERKIKKNQRKSTYPFS